MCPILEVKGEACPDLALIILYRKVFIMTDFPQTTNPVAAMLGEQITSGIAAIEEANTVLLAEHDGETGVREIDKELKNYVPSDSNDVADKDQELVKAAAQVEKAKAQFKKAQEAARNLYRTKVLGEEAVSETETEVDVDAVKAQRKLVMEAVTLLKSFAEGNKLPDVAKWANDLSIPQVGRQGSSSVGQKKPRAYVTVDDKTHESFGEAAKALTAILSTDENKVEVTSGDLVSAWDEAGEADTFDYQGHTVKVAKKESARKAA